MDESIDQKNDQKNPQQNFEAQPQPASPRQGGGSTHESAFFSRPPKWVLIASFIINLILIAAAGYYFLNKRVVNQPKACTQDAKLCPDGSYVSRTGPNCEFSPCPTAPTPTLASIDSSNWKTYENKELGFSIKYPEIWGKPVWPCHTNNSVCFTARGYNTANYREKPNKIGGTIGIYRGESYLNGFCKDKSKDSSIVSCDQSLLNGLAATKEVRVINDGFNNDESRIFYITHGKYYYQISGTFVRTDTLTEKEIDQILSTFTFAPLSASKSPDQTITPTCMPRPACLDATPRCLIPEPATGWCK